MGKAKFIEIWLYITGHRSSKRSSGHQSHFYPSKTYIFSESIFRALSIGVIKSRITRRFRRNGAKTWLKNARFLLFTLVTFHALYRSRSEISSPNKRTRGSHIQGLPENPTTTVWWVTRPSCDNFPRKLKFSREKTHIFTTLPAETDGTVKNTTSGKHSQHTVLWTHKRSGRGIFWPCTAAGGCGPSGYEQMNDISTSRIFIQRIFQIRT